jgi:hypothetical protein
LNTEKNNVGMTFKVKNNYCLLILFFGLFFSCSKANENTKTRFSFLNSGDTNIHFKNSIQETDDFNFLNYTYIYNGGGVAVLDVNNDGLEDLFFTSNQESNAL